MKIIIISAVCLVFALVMLYFYCKSIKLEKQENKKRLEAWDIILKHHNEEVDKYFNGEIGINDIHWPDILRY